MKVDGALLVDDPREAGALARRLEGSGYAGAFTFEGRHDPFLPLTIAAEHSERLELGTAIAVAFVRSPMSLAQLAYDLQLASRGRFLLGLGTQIRAHVEKRYGSSWGKPVARMDELVRAIRAIWRCWQEGEKLDFRGEYYRHTLMTPFFDPGPNPYGLPPILLAAVGPRMTALAGQEADGLLVHPFHTEESLRQLTLPALEQGFSRAGRSRDGFQISCQVILATGETEEEFETARSGARGQIAFYASTPAYRPVLECHDLGGLQEELNALSKRGAWLEMAGRIDDDLLEKIAVVGEKHEVAEQVRKRFAGIADRVGLVAPFAPGPESWRDLIRDLASA